MGALLRRLAVALAVSLVGLPTGMVLGDPWGSKPEIERARANVQRFLADLGVKTPLRVRSARFTAYDLEPIVTFTTSGASTMSVGGLTGDIKSYTGQIPARDNWASMTRDQLETMVRWLARKRGVDRYEIVTYDTHSHVGPGPRFGEPEDLAFVMLREKDLPGPYPVLDYGNHVNMLFGLRSGVLYSYEETRGFVKGTLPRSWITAEAAMKIAVQRFRSSRLPNLRAIGAKLGWVVPSRPARSKIPGKFQYEFAWDVRLSNNVQARIRASDGALIGRGGHEGTYEGLLERINRAGRPPQAR